MSLRIENKLSRKRRDEIKKLENNILKALNYLSEHSPNDGYINPSANTSPGGENTISL